MLVLDSCFRRNDRKRTSVNTCVDFALNGLDQRRLRRLRKQYKALRLDYENCDPLVIVLLPQKDIPSWRERFESPEVMLKASLKEVQSHLEQPAQDYGGYLNIVMSQIS